MSFQRSTPVFILVALVSSGHAYASQYGAYRYGPYPGGLYTAPAYPAHQHYQYAAMQTPHRNNPAYYRGHDGPGSAPLHVMAKPAGRQRPQANSDADRDSKLPSAKTPGATTDNKQVFISTLLPHIEKENRRLLALRKHVESLLNKLEAGAALREQDERQIKALAKQYRVKQDPLTAEAGRKELLGKVDIIPSSLALAQAANESAWGQSRFALEANNLFGIWTYDESKGIVPRKRAPGKKHLVRRFDSLSESVRYYLFTLNSHPAYAEMRAIRTRLRAAGKPLDGLALAEGLARYSAKGAEYVRIIQDVIRRFDLAAYDAGSADKA